MESEAMIASGIPSARKKLGQAKVHLDSLDQQIHSFRKGFPYEFEMTSAGNGPFMPDFWIDVTVTKAPPVPDLWALTTGDILTNLRGALDHAVFPHIRAKRPGLEARKIQFPIEDQIATWENKKQWFKRPVLKVVGKFQPYRYPDPPREALAVLRELVNMDKHRDLVIANYAVDSFVVAPQDFFEIVHTTVFKTEMTPGARVAKSHLKLVKQLHGSQWKHFPCHVEYGETIRLPGLDDRESLLTTMQVLVGFVEQVLDELQCAGC
jgi:hypothetical protein